MNYSALLTCKRFSTTALCSLMLSQTSPAKVNDCQGDLNPNYSQVAAIVIDRSTSMEANHGAMALILNEAADLLERVPNGSLVVVQYAAEDSLQTAEQVLRRGISQLNDPPICKKSLFGNLKAKRKCLTKKREYHAKKACVAEQHKAIVEKVRNLSPSKAVATDLNGAMFQIDQVFRRFPEAKKHLVIYSDLVDTRKRELPEVLDGFSNAQITIRYLVSPREHHENDLNAARQKRLEMEALFESWSVQKRAIQACFITSGFCGDWF